uniref:Succinate--CoA ligase [GDP-forming] subunit beta, mitochondrial n=1 Tax=Corethrella appendiculata TaxID=1370023 RepID=U5EJ13_9DIPT
MASLVLSKVCRNLAGKSYGKGYNLIKIRHLNLLEYQSKKLLDECGVAIQNFRVLEGKQDAKILDDFNVKEFVVKAQILAGGRGKGHFDTGFKGGVHITKDRSEVMKLVDEMVGHKLITKQTPKEGILVKKVMVADSINIVRETYLSIVMDREQNGPVIIASPAGGMDIEQVAEKTPEKILTIPVDILNGLPHGKCIEIAQFLEFKGKLVEKAAYEIQKLYRLFTKVDATQIEINPLAETDDGRVISVDAKLNFDDNAEFRQKKIFEMENYEDTDPKEIEATKYNLNYIAMDGNIGCLVNGAGLAMATMDIIKLNGGSPANFLDVGGKVTEDQVLKAFHILTSDSNVKAILVNVFGGIVNCATIAQGIVNASKVINLKIPVIVRLEGTNVSGAKKIIQESGLKVQFAQDLDDAARKAVTSIK